jgi:cephalosporin-C deacetylase-like acetyl esterase
MKSKFRFRFAWCLGVICFSMAGGLTLAQEAKQGPPADWTILPVPPSSQRVRVTPDHSDWTYALGEKVRFLVTIVSQPYPEAGVKISYRLGPDMLEGMAHTAMVPATGLTLDAGPQEQPGFLRCIVTTTDGRVERGLATAAVAPDQIRPTQTEPQDFDRFWAEQKAVLARVPMAPEIIPAPELSTRGVEVSYVSLQNVGGGAGNSRFHGVLAVPRGPGPFPAVLSVPGAGVRPYRGQVELAEHGLITLQVGIHGIPVNLPLEVYNELAAGALADYNRFNLDDRRRYYYRRVYLGCIRANDYLTTQPKWDHRNLIVMGGSQGGQLTIATAALDQRVTGLAADFPAFCDVTGYLHGRAGGWPGLFRQGAEALGIGLRVADAQILTTGYYDAVNFARRLAIPGHYSWGYNDQTCPPTSTFAAYNVITSPKELVIAPQQGHAASAAQAERVRAWILDQTGVIALAKPATH